MISLVLLTLVGILIAYYWYEFSELLIGSNLFQLEDSINDQQRVKHCLLLVEGGALALQNIGVWSTYGGAGLKILSCAALVCWILFSMMHLVVGGGVLF